ncbi:hypothetical protein KUW09_04760 [Mameliella alba]|nr:hypothetical protein [Antarctobacter heliothermus]MBY6143339.1 hypothetical protein [Mameliella alba]MBY6163988.1 hypothetical protein [Mameliella alba]MBY6172460.1 hypothetical protein [Mameliella alba]MBY6177474.1 hypothetical protein [Mameliella alba]
MTGTAIRSEYAVAPQPGAEDFRSFAHRELALIKPWRHGICFLPECGRQFVPAREWQIYCCDACKNAGTAELRKWGHKMALSALVWRMGKYEAENEALRDLTRAARRHVTHVQSAWLIDRRRRAGEG